MPTRVPPRVYRCPRCPDDPPPPPRDRAATAPVHQGASPVGQIAGTMCRHVELLTEAMDGERDACTDFRKHVAWYLAGFPVGADLRRRLAVISSRVELAALLGQLDPEGPFPVDTLGAAAGPHRLARQGVPAGWVAGRPGWRGRARGRGATGFRRVESAASGSRRVRRRSGRPLARPRSRMPRTGTRTPPPGPCRGRAVGSRGR